MNEKAGKVAGGKGSAIEILQACGLPHAVCLMRFASCLELLEISLSRRWWWSRKAMRSCSAPRPHETPEPESTAFTNFLKRCVQGRSELAKKATSSFWLNELKLFHRFPCLLAAMQATATMNAAVDFLTRNFKAGILLDFDSPSPEDSCLGISDQLWW